MLIQRCVKAKRGSPSANPHQQKLLSNLSGIDVPTASEEHTEKLRYSGILILVHLLLRRVLRLRG